MWYIVYSYIMNLIAKIIIDIAICIDMYILTIFTKT